MKLLAAIDGSAHSQVVIDALIGIQWPYSSQIELFTVIKPQGLPDFLHFANPVKVHEHELELAKVAEQALNHLSADLARSLPNCKITYEVTKGDPKHEIVNHAKTWEADTIILGSRGASGALMGSVSQAVLGHSPCPVIVLPSIATTQVEEQIFSLQEGINNILFAVDNSPFSQVALDWLSQMRWGNRTRIKLLTVVQPHADDSETVATALGVTSKQEVISSMAGHTLQEMANKLIPYYGSQNITTQIGRGDPREVILHTQAAWGADLIVMGSHGKTGLTKLMLGSVSQTVSTHAPCAVAIVRGLIHGLKTTRQTGLFEMPVLEDPANNRPQEDTDYAPPHCHPGGF